MTAPDDRWTIEPFEADHNAPEGDKYHDCDGGGDE